MQVSCDSFYCWAISSTQVTNTVKSLLAPPVYEFHPGFLLIRSFLWASLTATQCHLMSSKCNKLFLKSLKLSQKNLKIKTWLPQSIGSQAYLEKNYYIICLGFHLNNPNFVYKIMGSELIITAQDGMMMVMKIPSILKWSG